MLSHPTRRHSEPIPTPAEQAAARRAYLDTFQALSPAARELAYLENKDARWSAADRRRYGELMRLTGGEG